MSTTQREFDLIVWGATGFTGRLVAEYLAQQEGVGRGLRWAIAGRSGRKLDEVVAAIGASVPGIDVKNLPRLIADSADLDSLRALVARTRSLISTVGPYALYGSKLVQACAESGTHYCDLAGEPQWIRSMIHAWDAAARKSGARIVHCCGFDSIPFDMGVWYLQRELQSRSGKPAPEVHGVVRRMRGGASGGTIASMLNFVEEAARDPVVRRLAADANALLPPEYPPARPVYLREGAAFESALGVWTGPFVMAAINLRIVRRSNALLGFPWGREFMYREAIATGRGPAGQFRAHALKAGLGMFLAGAALGPTRALMRRMLPQSGEGPDAAARNAGFYVVDFIGFDGAGGKPLAIATVEASLDPGYGSTARMLAETGLCLAQDKVDSGGGSWTPAACLGEALLARLTTRAGLKFSVREPR